MASNPYKPEMSEELYIPTNSITFLPDGALARVCYHRESMISEFQLDGATKATCQQCQMVWRLVDGGQEVVRDTCLPGVVGDRKLPPMQMVATWVGFGEIDDDHGVT